MKLGRLEKVDLREVWISEASNFTPWLAREENLRLLGETIGIELELESQEKEVGPFRADILCKDTATDNWVLIENQLERTDHLHLGQLITYAAGLNAVTVVWIAQRFTEEHRAALDWLNERTDEKINVFGLEVELWRIGGSDIAPKFNVISQPNNWTRTVQQAASTGVVTEHKQLQLRFWTAFAEFMEEQQSPLRCTKPSPRHWMTLSLGRSGFSLSAVVSSWNSVTNAKGPEIRAELVMNRESSKSDFAALEARKAELETQLGFPLTWHNPTDKTMCRIFTRKDADFTDEAQWRGQFAWLKEKLELLHRVFAPLVRSLNGAAGE
jgi:hypothetical protein